MSSSAILGRMPLLPLPTVESPKHWSTVSLLAHRAPSNFDRQFTANRKWRVKSTEKCQSDSLEKNKSWEECKMLISFFDFTAEEADSMLGKAFGWAHSPYWGEEREKEIPSQEAVSETLTFLTDLGLSKEDLSKLLKKFPEVLGCSLDGEVKLNVSLLKSNWGIKDKALTKLLVRNPKVLGYNVDCKGDCIAQCTRCWARF